MSVTSEVSSLDSVGFNFDDADFDLDVLDDFDLISEVIGEQHYYMCYTFKRIAH